MTRAAITVDGAAYTYALGDHVAPGRRLGALVRGRAVDELTGDAVAAPLLVRAAGPDLTRPSVATWVTGHSLAGVHWSASSVFPPRCCRISPPRPTSSASAPPVPATCRGPESPPTVPWPGHRRFPARSRPPTWGTWSCTGGPLALAGRTLTRTLAGQIVAAPGRPVRLASYWRRVANPMPAGSPNDLIAFAPPLTETLARGATVTHVALAPIGAPKTLETDAQPGSTELRLSDGQRAWRRTSLSAWSRIRCTRRRSGRNTSVWSR